MSGGRVTRLAVAVRVLAGRSRRPARSTGRLSLVFDLGFVLRLRRRSRCRCGRSDFFRVGVLPPLLMLGLIALRRGRRTAGCGRRGRRRRRAGGRRPGSPTTGRAARWRLPAGLATCSASAQRATGRAPGVAGSTRTATGSPAADPRRPPARPRSSRRPWSAPAGVSPASTTTSTTWSSSSLISQPIGPRLVSPAGSACWTAAARRARSSSAWTTAWSGIRTPTVRFFGCISRRGTSRVAGRMNV